MVTPAIPRFFCAPAKIKSYFFISIGLEAMVDDISQIRGDSDSIGSCISKPCTVSFAQ